MKPYLALLVLPFLSSQSASPPKAAPAAAHEIAVEVGQVPMQGLWYQDEIAHVHDKVRITQSTHPNGSVEVTLGTGGEGGTDLTLTFSHDANGATTVSALAVQRRDVQFKGNPSVRHIGGMDGRVIVHSNDWGPGKDITCMFALHGMSGKEPVLLMGSFLIVLPN
jgi:hypothetical protein